jgi:hypothetical protein
MNKDVETNTFGVPVGDTSIPGMLAMQKQLHHNRKHVKGPHVRSLFSRILLIIVSIILLVPGAFFIYVAFLAYRDTGTMTAIIVPATLGIIFIGGGLMGIISGIRK